MIIRLILIYSHFYFLYPINPITFFVDYCLIYLRQQNQQLKLMDLLPLMAHLGFAKVPQEQD